MSSAVRELASKLLQLGSSERLETPLDALAAQEGDADFAEQLLAAHVDGVAHTLRDALEDDRLERWVTETCTAREEAAVVQGLSRWLGQTGSGGDDAEGSIDLSDPPSDPRGLQSWAEAHGVRDLLDQPFAEAGGAPLRAVCLGETAANARSLLDESREAERGRASLRQAAAARAALALRRTRWQSPAPEGAASLLFERLRALLIDTSPETLAGVRFVPAHPVQVDVQSAVVRGRVREVGGAEGVAVRLLLGGYEHGGLVGECNHCEGPRCLHVQALAARLLDALAVPDDRLNAALTGLAEEPSWKRFVRQLHASDAGEGPAESDSRLCFRLREQGDALQVGVLLQKRLGKGVWSAGKLASPQKLLRQAPRDDDDRQVLESMARRGLSLSPAPVAADVDVLRALVEHPRVQWEAGRDAPPVALRVGEARLSLELRPGPQGLTPTVSLAGRPLPAGSLRKPQGHVCRLDGAAGSLTFAVLTPPLRRLLKALDHFRGALPPESHAALAHELAGLRRVADVRAPESLLGRELPAPRKLLLRIVPSFDEGIDVTLSTRPLPLGALWPPGLGPERTHGLVEGEAVFTRRDLAWERETARDLHEVLGLEQHLRVDDFRYRVEGTQSALGLLSAAAGQTARLELEWAERVPRLQLGPTLRTGDLHVKLFKRGEWLKLKGGASHASGDIPVQRLLDAARQGERFVRVGGDCYAEIEQALFERLERAQLCVVDPRALSPTLTRASLPFALEQLPGELEVAPEARDWVEAARRPGEPPELDAHWHGVLRDYQREGVRWLFSLAAWAPGACLADDMGLGKTLQAIALLDARRERGPALVVAPTSVARNWRSEIERFGPALRPALLEGPRAVETQPPPGPGDVWILSYDRLLREREALAGFAFATQVVDEAQLLKNARTRRAQAARAIRADFRLALTGTPIENRLGDLWSLFQLIAPGLLGSWARFRAIFAVPIERHQNADRAADLRALVAPLLLRRLKRDVARELPTRTEAVQLVALSPAERALYESTLRRVRKHLRTRRRERNETLTVLGEITRLRQLACHPRLVLDEPAAESSKLAALMQLLDDVLPRGHRVLIFSQFVRHLHLVREVLETRAVPHLYLDGATPARERARLVERFQGGEGQAFLISLKAGGTGLNLTAADYVVHLDPWWNPAAEDQASDRAHRIGQQRPVTIVKLVTENTIEERVLSLHAHKRELSGAVLDGRGEPVPFDMAAMRALLDVNAG